MTEQAKDAAAPTSTSYTLKFPVPYTPPGGQPTTLTSLTIRRFKGKDIVVTEAAVARGQGHLSTTLEIIASMNNLPGEVAAEIDAEDLMEVADRMADFLPERFRKAAREAQSQT